MSNTFSRKFYLFIVLMSITAVAYGQIRVVHPTMISADKNSFKLRNYFKVSETSINDVLDTERYVWVGTSGSGLIRFDKTDSTKKYFTVLNSPIPENYIKFIRESKDGAIWICSGDQILSYKKNRWNNHGSPRKDYHSIKDLSVAPDGSIWMFSYYGYFQYQNKEWKSFKLDSIPGAKDEVTALFIDSKNRLWLFAGKNMHCRIEKDWVNYGEIFGDETFLKSAIEIAENDKGTIWCRNILNHVKFFNGTEWVSCKNECYSRYEHLFNRKHWIYDKVKHLGNADMPFDRIDDIRFNPDGNVYIKSWGSIYKLVSGKWSHLSLPSVVRFDFDKKGALYVGGEDNFYKYDSIARIIGFQEYTNAYRFEQIKPRTTDIHFDDEGSLWVGNYVAFAQLKNKRWKFYSAKEFGLPDISTRAIESDVNGDVWISTWRGVIQLSNDTFYVHKNFTSGSRDIITRIERSKTGELWFGKRTLGVIRKTMNELIEYEPLLDKKKVIFEVEDIEFDRNDNVWILANSRLYLYKKEKWYSLSSVLPVHISCIAIHGDEVWIGTESSGIFILRNNNL